MSLYKMLSPYLFKLDAEKAHCMAELALKHIVPLPLVQDYVAGKYCVVDEHLNMEVAGLRFYNPVGLAAGFDKNATMVRGLSALGFGFLEIGTITQSPQEGNPKPRLFRYVEERSLQNEMGFNNQGSLEIVQRLKNIYPYSIPLGINVGKNKIIAQSDSLKNYENVLLDCLSVGDYFVFNLSSPNTPNLRDLQNVHFVQELFTMARSYTQKPLFIKISPDMDKDEMLKIVEMSIKYGANGVIATNTTIDYAVLTNARETGGISGEALKKKSKEVLRILSEAFFGKTTLISVGGVDSALEAYERIKLGASLVQVLSGLIFEGPRLCQQINEGLLQYLKEDGFTHLYEAVGQDIAHKPKRGRKSKAAQALDSMEVNTEISTSLRTSKSKKSAQKVESQNKPAITRNTNANRASATKKTASRENTKAQQKLDSTESPKPTTHKNVKSAKKNLSNSQPSLSKVSENTAEIPKE